MWWCCHKEILVKLAHNKIYIEQTGMQYSGTCDSNGRIGVTKSLSLLSMAIVGLFLEGGS